MPYLLKATVSNVVNCFFARMCPPGGTFAEGDATEPARNVQEIAYRPRAAYRRQRSSEPPVPTNPLVHLTVLGNGFPARWVLSASNMSPVWQGACIKSEEARNSGTEVPE